MQEETIPTRVKIPKKIKIAAQIKAKKLDMTFQRFVSEALMEKTKS